MICGKFSLAFFQDKKILFSVSFGYNAWYVGNSK